MDPRRWDRVKTLYDEAQARPATDRAAFLAGACLGDVDLQREVQTLLDQPLSTDSFVSMVGGTAATSSAGRIPAVCTAKNPGRWPMGVSCRFSC